MKITKLTAKVVQLYPRVKFKIALSDQATGDTVLVKIETDTGLVGYGEANPFAPVTGESVETILAFYGALGTMLEGRSPFELEAIHRMMRRLAQGNTAAKAGIDIALHDLCAKAAGVPLYRYLGGSRNVVESDMTIGIDPPELMAQKAQQYVREGFTMLKIKVGLNPTEDLEALRLIRQAVGADIELRLDANQGWKKKQAMETMKAMEAYGVSEIEQPLPFHDLEGMAFLTEHITQDVMADESVHSPEDAMKLLRRGACDIINIKLMKSAGIYPALQINAAAQAANIPCMVGCMSETILGIAAGAALVASRENILYADLDGHRVIQDVPGLSGGFTQEGGRITLSSKPGLGLDVTLF